MYNQSAFSRAEHIFSSASRSVESEGQGCLSSVGVDRRFTCAPVLLWGGFSREVAERQSGCTLLLGPPFSTCPVVLWQGPASTCRVLLSWRDFAPGVVMERPERLHVRAAACFTPSVAEACIYLLHLSCSTVPRTFYHGDIAERPERLYASSWSCFAYPAVLRRFCTGDIARRTERLHISGLLARLSGCCTGLGKWPIS
ncbi:hypothetical protein CgunFtcFv8_022954 [Champsocephalus gunnari]|uniref:Uncharacterized protein n=1 Tax=Champsocephalus gunnari TaxID=52237 RepID=A0AAN8DDU1_CHAGU|nr:hypothetical protein CgunFtcFv8_022954 [Champsocephalus gunnari]